MSACSEKDEIETIKVSCQKQNVLLDDAETATASATAIAATTETDSQVMSTSCKEELTEITKESCHNEHETAKITTQPETTDIANTQLKSDNKDITSVQACTQDDNAEYAKHVTYADDGSAIYTDPNTKTKYKWSNEKNAWEEDKESNPYENEFYKWCNETQQWLPKEPVTENEHFKWNAEQKQWVPKQTNSAEQKTENSYGLDENGQRIYTDKDGAVFFWDDEKSAWFPKIDDEFMARYQMNYGFIDNTSAAEEEKRFKEAEEVKRKAEQLQRMTEEAKAAAEEQTNYVRTGKRKAPQEPPKWFDMDPTQNTKVYVSNLPLDITLDEFAELMSKCGVIMRDPKTKALKLKLYTEANGQIKGDGLCDYIKVESVHLALEILDEYVLRDHKIHVQRAQFQMRGEYNPALKPKRRKEDKDKLAKLKERLLDWRPEKMRGERSKNERTVIIKRLFDPIIFEKEVQLILEYQNQMREECSKCGTVRKVIICDRHPEGVAQIVMASPEEADVVIEKMHGRFFGNRQVSAEHWDGKTKYKIAESEKEQEKRLSNWDQFLEAEEEQNAASTATEGKATTIIENPTS